MLKIALIGDGNVGKTSLRERFMGRGFPERYIMTIGSDFSILEKTIDGTRFLFQVWDLAGQPMYKMVRKNFYKGCRGALAVFDLTAMDSFEHIEEWVDELWENNGDGVMPIVIVGNKSDQLEKEVSEERAKAMANLLSEKTKEYGYEIPYISTSALLGENVNEAFYTLGRSIIDFKKKSEPIVQSYKR
jgi:small GTP-binding protein